MIKRKTALIIGAGASIPYGFPSGIDLVKTICKNLYIAKDKDIDMTIGINPWFNILIQIGFRSEKILEFRDALHKCGHYNIDEFLEHRREFDNIGKYAIALALVPHENTDLLFDVDEPQNWYKYLYSRMKSSLEDFDKNNISFITFNYDRSLEHFLFTSLKHSYGVGDDKIAEKLSILKIIHLHGQLGFLPWQEKDEKGFFREYTSESDIYQITAATRNIKILHEDLDRDNQFLEARQILSEAEKIYFLGFGFHQINLKRLDIVNLSGNKAIFGTSIGFSRNEKLEICRNVNNKIIPDYLKDVDIIKIFREFWALD